METPPTKPSFQYVASEVLTLDPAKSRQPFRSPSAITSEPSLENPSAPPFTGTSGKLEVKAAPSLSVCPLRRASVFSSTRYTQRSLTQRLNPSSPRG